MLNLCHQLERFELDFGVNIYWNVVDQMPASASNPADWETWQDAFQCLAALRGLKWGSVKGIDPLIHSSFSRHINFDPPYYGRRYLMEVANEKVEAMKKCWLKPKGARKSRVQRALKDLKSVPATS